MVGRAALGLWGVGILVVGASLMAGHLVSLPAPKVTDNRLRSSLRAGPGVVQGRWSAHHVLYQSCGCSQRVLAHLLERQARPDLVETVVYVRDPSSSDLTERDAVSAQARLAGFGFEASTPAELESRYAVESAPFLLVGDGSGGVRYAGGYTDRSGSKQIEDIAIIDGLRAGRKMATLPVFGCAVSSRVQEAIDPLGLKYRRGSSL
ncbi:MAG TPA: hypothetical protein VKO16_00325 [Polyangia bacterium]|nr:hypothetical protein [Polyangia bacterium]